MLDAGCWGSKSSLYPLSRIPYPSFSSNWQSAAQTVVQYASDAELFRKSDCHLECIGPVVV
jgi:hypothetical protein